MGNVIQGSFATRLPAPAPQVSFLHARGSHGCAFTSHDLIALACWNQSADRHGYHRTLLERGSVEGGPDEGGYVLVYAPGSEWARYGLARVGAEILTWRCSDGVDLGRSQTMLQALERLPPVMTRRAGLCAKPIGTLRRYPVARPA